MSKFNTSRVSRESLRIASIERPGWGPALGRVPSVGEYIYCLGGPAQVMRILGRTTDGSRLLELQCVAAPHRFFASSSNILMRTDDADQEASPKPAEAGGGA